MRHTFEIFISGNQLTVDNWQKFYRSFNSYAGLVGKMRMAVVVKDNVVRYFVQSDKDLGSLSNNLEGMVLREVPQDELDIPTAVSKEVFIRFVTGGNLLDFKEKLTVKRGIDLQVMVMNITAFNATNALVKAKLIFKKPSGGYSYAKKTMTIFPAHLLAVDFSGSNSSYLKKKIGKYLDIEKSLHLFTSDDNHGLFKVEGFPYLKGDYYLNLYNYDFAKHSFIVGASGSGKSKLISLIVDRLAASSFKDQYSVVVIDPHNSLKEEFLHINDSVVVGFGNDSVELFNDSPKDIQAEAELTSTLFKSLIGDLYNPRLERVLKYSLYVLFTSKSMSLDQLKRFLTENDLRNQIVEHVKDYVPDNVVRFFGADYNEIRTQHYNDAVLPIVSLVDEMAMQPGMTTNGQASIAGMVNDNFLTVFSLNKVSMGDKVVKTVSGLIIQQLFLLAQARAFNNKKIILIIDEVSVVQNPALAQILAEARKFGLSLFLTQQYFGQIDKDIRDAIFANTYNYYVFKVSEEDARALEGNLSIELPKSIVESESAGGLKEADIRVKILTELSPRECLVRLAQNGKIHPCIKARTVDAEFFQANEQAAQDLQKVDKINLPDKFVEHSESINDLPKVGLGDTPTTLPSLQENNINNQVVSEPSTGQEPPTVESPNFPMGDILSSGSIQLGQTHTNQTLENNNDITGQDNEEFINISMLLAEQSSSRKVVNKYKEGIQDE